MKLSKLTKVAIPVSIAGLVLAGCGGKPAHHTEHHSKTPTYTIHHRPATKSEKDGTKTVNKSSYDNIPATDTKTVTVHQNTPTKKATLKPSKTVNKSAKPSYKSTDPMHADLGYGITGNVGRGAGQIYVTFNMGHWQITSHGNDVNENADTAVNNARKVATWAQSHTLPYPSSIGTIHVESDGTATISWDGHTAHGALSQVLAYAVAHQDY